MGLLNYRLVSLTGGIWKRPRAKATSCADMGLRKLCAKGVVVVDMVSAARRLRRLMGRNELLGF